MVGYRWAKKDYVLKTLGRVLFDAVCLPDQFDTFEIGWKWDSTDQKQCPRQVMGFLLILTIQEVLECV